MSKPIRFRSPTDATLHVATTSGHTARIGAAWRELPHQLHAAAIAGGAVTDNMDATTVASQRATLEPEPQSAPHDSEALIRQAIATMLEGDDREAFTKAGLPDLRRLSALAGFSVDRQQMQDIWHAMVAECEAVEQAQTDAAG